MGWPPDRARSRLPASLGRPPQRLLQRFEIPNDLVLESMPPVANHELGADCNIPDGTPLAREHDVIQERARTGSGYGRVAQIDGVKSVDNELKTKSE